jgi:hypothetical protein
MTMGFTLTGDGKMKINPEWTLLDNQANVDLLTNGSLLTNICQSASKLNKPHIGKPDGTSRIFHRSASGLYVSELKLGLGKTFSETISNFVFAINMNNLGIRGIKWSSDG